MVGVASLCLVYVGFLYRSYLRCDFRYVMRCWTGLLRGCIGLWAWSWFCFCLLVCGVLNSFLAFAVGFLSEFSAFTWIEL